MEEKNSLDMEIDSDDIVIVADEDGNEHECVIVDVLEYKGKNYASLVPCEFIGDDSDEGDTADLFVMEIEQQDGQEYLKSIADNDDYEEICKLMIDRLSDDFDVEL
jgi:uncharacterized protein YrzB (UPF0473 family)